MAQQHINTSSPNDGLGDSLRTSQVKAEANFTELYANKVDKITGKSLSDTNFTQIEKDKLAGLTTGGQLQSNWTEGDIASKAYILNKITNVSSLTNDAGYITSPTVAGLFFREAGAWTVASLKVMEGTTGVTTGFAVAQLDYTLPNNAIVLGVFINKDKQYLQSTNNATRPDLYTKTGNVLTLKKSPVLNNYIYIEYL